MNKEKSSTEKRICSVCGKQLKSNQKTFCSKECCHSMEGQAILFKKRTQTNLEKYGAENPFQSEEIKEKIKKTCLEKYGTEHAQQTEEVKEKMKQTNLKKYGVVAPCESEEVKEKMKQTNLKKYGVEYVPQFNDIKDKMVLGIRKTNANIFLKNIAEKGLSLLSSINDYYEVKSGDILKFKCNRCGNIFDYHIKESGLRSRNMYCPSQVHKNTSQYEQELFDWLSSLGVKNIERNKRDWNTKSKIYEADLYLPDFNLAIKYNGFYWHSNLNKDDDYHYNKWKFFKEQNIDCIQIFENEWRDKKDIVKSIIMNRLGLNTKIQIDRIERIDLNTYKQFIDSNYIFDYVDSEYKFGMYNNDGLVAVVGISNNKVDIFCSKINYDLIDNYLSIINYFKQLFKQSILINLDNRYFNGNKYDFLHYVDDIDFKYYYFKNNELILSEQKSDDCLWICDCGKENFIL